MTSGYPFTISGDSIYRIYNQLNDSYWKDFIHCIFPKIFHCEIQEWPMKATPEQRDIVILSCGSAHKGSRGGRLEPQQPKEGIKETENRGGIEGAVENRTETVGNAGSSGLRIRRVMSTTLAEEIAGL
jgi:hypothetical protein